MKIQVTILVMVAAGLVGCADSHRAVRPDGSLAYELQSDAQIVQKKAEASIHPKENYVLGQVQVRVTSEEDVRAVIDDMLVKKGLSLAVLDKIPNEPIYLMEVNSIDPVDDVVKTLKSDSRVVMAARNHVVKANEFMVNDPLAPTQWGLSNRGQEAPRALAGRAGADIGMEGVTAEGSQDVVVAIIDTGIDYLHEDLAITETVDGKSVVLPGSNIWVNPGEIPNNGINDDNNGDPKHGLTYVDDVYGYNFVARNGDPRDDQGHGTHVAGVIGALRNNFKGIVGINQKVSMMALKFLSADGGGSDFDAQLALYYVIDMKKRFPNKKFITSNSWGSAGRSSKNGDEDDFLLMAFAAASRADILNIAAAGNDNTSNRFMPHYPSNYASKLPNFISVAATNNLDQLASFSSYGYEQVQIAAPGVMIMSSVPPYLFGGTAYAAWSGTSMATPHVSGAAALLWSTQMNMSSKEVKERLLNTVDVLPQLTGSVLTAGRLNVKRAIAGIENKKVLPVIQEVPYTMESPRGSVDSVYDVMNKIEYKGAKQIQVCFKRINLEPDLDWMEVMSSDYRVRDTLSGRYEDTNWKGERMDLCTAPVLGDTVYLRLSKQGKPEGIPGFEVRSLKVVMEEPKASSNVPATDKQELTK